METSRKRTKTNDDKEGNKRITRNSSRKSKPKTKTVETKNVNSEDESISSTELNMECRNADITFIDELNKSSNTDIIQACSEPYRLQIDKKIIKYFKENMYLLNMRDDLSVYQVLKAKYLFQKSAQSLQLRFLNVILPNLFKYDVLDHSDIIDFYDAAKMELPEEFLKILNGSEEINKTNKNIDSVRNESVAISSKSSQIDNNVQCSVEGGNSCDNHESALVLRSRCIDNESDDSDSEVVNPPAEKCLKTILDFILLNNSKGDCVFIPETEPDIAAIERRLSGEFQIQPDAIKVVPSDVFNALKRLKEAHDVFDNLVYDVLKNRLHDAPFVETMLPDVQQLSEFLMEISNRSNNETAEHETTACLLDSPNESGEFKIEDVTILPNSLDHISISSGSDSYLAETVKLENKNEEEKEKEEDEEKHTHHKQNNNNTTLSPNNYLSADECERNSQNDDDDDDDDNVNISPNSSLIESACMPQIMFSQRSQHKIINEHINVDHLLVQCLPKLDETPNENHSNETQLNT